MEEDEKEEASKEGTRDQMMSLVIFRLYPGLYHRHFKFQSVHFIAMLPDK